MKKTIILLTVGLVVVLVVGVISFARLSVTDIVSAQEAVEIPFLEEWQSSGHADATAEAFVHWDEESPAEVPENCAKCHSTPGYLDFVGADGSAAGTVDKTAPIGTVVECVACHNNATLVMDSVVMPSGVEIVGLGDESRCMQCHQGRASTVQVDESIANANLTDVDTVSPDLGFTNIHYFAAAATKYGTVAKGGYQYEGKSYDGNFAHVEEFDTCIECHDSHTLQVKVEACQGCHEGVASVEDLKNIRMPGSLVDYDGDGDTEEGIAAEIAGMQETLYAAIQTYAIEKSQAPIVYEPATHPYFFLDTNKNGAADPDEANGDNRYNAWTARLAKAAFNYQVSIKDPGAYAHGGKYIIQLLYDSTEDLNAALSTPVDLSNANRIDDGHFAGSEEAFRHWDAEGEVPATCAKCHSAEGLPTFLKDGANVSVHPSNGLQCATCHNDLTTFSRYEVEEVRFPSGAVLSLDNPDANLCLNCHQGRESTVSVNNLIEGLDPDAGSEQLRFLNVHYFAAGATLFGTEAKGAYEYEGKTYVGRFEHVEEADTCIECHNTHGLEVKVELCSDCHGDVASEEDLRAIRESGDDFDGDGDTDEGLAAEIDTMREALYAAIQDYATNTAGADLVYNSQSYPYFFADANGNGEADADEEAYSAWTPRLLQAAYNYQYSTKDPGTFAHNGLYIIQTLYDSLEDLGADVSTMTRP
ncbi:MAG: cytochrome c3 family protein [Anaerolineae bacterium]|nr:cytochrome c3 family protein [Anaerolineae bacterium]